MHREQLNQKAFPFLRLLLGVKRNVNMTAEERTSGVQLASCAMFLPTEGDRRRCAAKTAHTHGLTPLSRTILGVYTHLNNPLPDANTQSATQSVAVTDEKPASSN